MKKLILAISVVVLGLYVKAYSVGNQIGVPEGDSQQIVQTTDYGGVYYATSAYSIAVTTVISNTGSTYVGFSTNVAPGRFVVYGVNFSTGICGDWVDLFDSTAMVTVPQTGLIFQPTVRFLNVYGSTSSPSVVGQSCSGWSGLPRPIRFSKGLMFKPSSTAYQMINVLYWKEEK